MKRTLACLLLAAVCWTGPLARASTSHEFVTGEDWTDRMSPREKQMSLIPPSILFSEYDVHLKLTLPQYVLLIDRVMARNPQLAEEEVSSVFASTVYIFEPENRAALRQMEMNFLEGDYESRPAGQPRLTLSDYLSETAALES